MNDWLAVRGHSLLAEPLPTVRRTIISMPAPEDLQRFITASFRSVWSLELLLLLKREPGLHERSNLILKLRASELVIVQGLESLVAAGLVIIDESGRAQYMPVSADLQPSIEQVEELYARKPDAVRRMIVGGGTRGLDAFANAFRLRRD